MNIADFEPIPAPIQSIQSKVALSAGIEWFAQREDLIHPTLNGNKWRKLKYNLLEAQKQGCKTLVAMGGPYSNLIKAVAAAGNLFQFQTIGLIRGEKVENPVLDFANKMGMQFQFIERSLFKTWREDPATMQDVLQQFDKPYFIPEGGTNALALPGVAEMNVPDWADVIITACGTGGTLAGLASTVLQHQTTIGIAVLKDQGYLDNEVMNLLSQAKINKLIPESSGKWQLIREFHGGGYAKVSPELQSFCVRFSAETGIPVEPIYTGKVFFALEKLTQLGFFPHGSKILVIHTGGLNH
jgi:1-aminocyclopropane-1-carboxylate deaminase